MVIEVLSLVKQASSYEDGAVVFAVLKDALTKHDSVELSFTGVTAVPTAFVNSALLQLLDHFSFDDVKRKLKIVNSTKLINDTVKHRFNFVAGSNKAA